MTSAQHAGQHSRYPLSNYSGDLRLPSLKDLNFYRPPPGNTQEPVSSHNPNPNDFVASPPDHIARNVQWGRPPQSTAMQGTMPAHSQHSQPPQPQQHSPPLSAGHDMTEQNVQYNKHDGVYARPGIPLSAQVAPVPGSVNAGPTIRNEDASPHSPIQPRRPRPSSTNMNTARDGRPSHTSYPAPYHTYASNQPPSSSYHQLPNQNHTPHSAATSPQEQLNHNIPVPNHPTYNGYQQHYMQSRQPVHPPPQHAPQPTQPPHHQQVPHQPQQPPSHPTTSQHILHAHHPQQQQSQQQQPQQQSQQQPTPAHPPPSQTSVHPSSLLQHPPHPSQQSHHTSGHPPSHPHQPVSHQSQQQPISAHPPHGNPYPSPNPAVHPPQSPWAQQSHPQQSHHQPLTAPSHAQQAPQQTLPPAAHSHPHPHPHHAQHHPPPPSSNHPQPNSAPTPTPQSMLQQAQQQPPQQHHHHQQHQQHAQPPPLQPSQTQHHPPHHPQAPTPVPHHTQHPPQHPPNQPPQHPQSHAPAPAAPPPQSQIQPPPPPQQQQQQQQLPFTRTAPTAPASVDSRSNHYPPPPPQVAPEPERAPEQYNDPMNEIVKHCNALYQFANRYAAFQQSMPHAQPSPAELHDMSQKALQVVRLLEDFKKTHLPDSERNKMDGSSEDHRAPKRPWEDMGQDGAANGEHIGDFPSGTDKAQSTAEQDMQIIRSKRATSTAGANNTAGQTKSKYRKRSRATPPGKCHSCNIRETPEWRRGPDGARTLCNACGLHYAKLMRKRDKADPTGQTPRIDLETLRASARAAESSDKSRSKHKSVVPESSSPTETKPNSQQHHQGSFQLMNVMAQDPAGPSDSNRTTIPPQPTQAPLPPVQATSGPLPVPPWATPAQPPQPLPATSAPPPMSGRTYPQDHLQHQSFMRTSQHSSAAQASSR